MRIEQLLLSACSLIAGIQTVQGFVSDVNPRLTTVGPAKKVHEVTNSRGGKHHQVRARDNDRIIFPASSSQGDLGRNPDHISGDSQGQTDNLAGAANTRGSFVNPSTQSMQLKSSISKYQAPIHPFERDDGDDGPIWPD
ncbi:hypothetical protein GE061_002395 [Apolygus lucorum]|uniref:Attacin C-terminal domain-containing protein n=1 Tax=Apolygus lucorum TaxID=248454 RepID=A0A8S9X913_APOLU|nr:hypothetical protein GE061_002395 [Apolygus lucorum]